MRRIQLYPFVALGMSVWSQHAAAQTVLADQISVKPAIMLMVDTSGSMERMPVSSACSDANCLPKCVSGNYQKNRWAVTLEALNGTYSTFKCTEKVRSTTYPGQYDADYFLSHYDFTGSTQASDGVIDTYNSIVKFGLMTFDGVSTTVNGATLVPWAQYNITPPYVRPSIIGAAGMYSYPDVTATLNNSLDTPQNAYGWKPLAFPNCTTVYGVNAGARAPVYPPDPVTYPGSMIPFSQGDDSTSTSRQHSYVKQSLANVRPYAGTPIAAMLDDLRYYLNNGDEIKPWDGTKGDQYYSCRKRYAILLTDGAPDQLFRGDPRFACESTNHASCGGHCQCPYDTETNLAKKLVNSDGLSKLWVVAFNVNDASAVSALNSIASYGNTTSAYLSNDLTTLRQNLNTIIRGTAPPPTSRSVPVVVNTGAPIQLGGMQYTISAGFKVGQTVTDPWEGRLYRQRIDCGTSGNTVTPETIDTTKGDSFHDALNAQSSRTLQTVFPSTGTSGKPVGNFYAWDGTTGKPTTPTATTNLMLPSGGAWPLYAALDDGSGNPDQAVEDFGRSLTTLDKNALPAYFPGDADGNGSSATTADRDRISDYLYGISNDRKTKKLGDIYHSNPTVQLPIYARADQTSVFDPQLRQFYTDLLNQSGTTYPQGNYKPNIGWGRPGVVYVGTNDGILHAFNLDAWSSKTDVKTAAATELWGFVPPALFSKLATIAQPTHTTGFDGTPIVKDMITVRTSNGTTTMKTILLAAVRGAPAFVALDVTYPEKPAFLWQRSFKYLGATVGQPALAEVSVLWNGVVQTRAVAILPGGQGVAGVGNCAVDPLTRGVTLNSGRTTLPCWKMLGRSLYVVDVDTGMLIQEFDSRHFSSPMTGGVAVDGVDLAQTRAAYMTDQDGTLWRLSMFSSDPTQWRVQPIWDLFAGQATGWDGTLKDAATPSATAGRVSSYPPLLARDSKTGNLTIVVGTGDVDAISDAAPNRVVSLTEIRTMSNGELKFPVSNDSPKLISANWNLQLNNGEAVTGPLVMLDDAVYFAAFTGPAGGAGNVCNTGASRMVGADVRATDSANASLPKPRLTPEAGGPSLVLQYTPTNSSSLILGMSLARDPVCIPGTPTNSTNPIFGRITPNGNAASGGNYHLRAMVAGGNAGSVMDGTDPSGSGQNAQRQVNLTLPVTNVSRAVGWASSIE